MVVDAAAALETPTVLPTGDPVTGEVDAHAAVAACRAAVAVRRSASTCFWPDSTRCWLSARDEPAPPPEPLPTPRAPEPPVLDVVAGAVVGVVAAPDDRVEPPEEPPPVEPPPVDAAWPPVDAAWPPVDVAWPVSAFASASWSAARVACFDVNWLWRAVVSRVASVCPVVSRPRISLSMRADATGIFAASRRLASG